MNFALFFIVSAFCIINCLMINSYPHNKFPKVNVIGTITEKPDIPLPKNISVPNDHKFKFLLSAYGVQIYKCVVNEHVPNNWTQVTPDTYCVNDKRTETFVPEYEVAYHYMLKKPIHEGRAVWESLVKGDDSLLVAKNVATNVSPDGKMNLPWLVNKATAKEDLVISLTSYGSTP
ncbi:2661_t:CDS:2 [Funneliformis geosporum]|nr:2661_t:CDS:2 [Funneliformis geosporum]